MNLHSIAQSVKKSFESWAQPAKQTPQTPEKTVEATSDHSHHALKSYRALIALEQRKDFSKINADIPGKIGAWDVPFVHATDLQSKNPSVNLLYRNINNTAGILAAGVNGATNLAGNILFDLPAAVEEFSVSHGGPSTTELMVAAQVTEGPSSLFKLDDALAYGLGSLAKFSKTMRGMEGLEAQAAKVAGGAIRAEKYSNSWPRASLKETVKRIAGKDVVPVPTDSGKLIYTNAKTGIQVVHDKAGNYFTVIDPKIKSKELRYLSLEGKVIPPNVTLIKASKTVQVGLPKDVRRSVTHFYNTD